MRLLCNCKIWASVISGGVEGEKKQWKHWKGTLSSFKVNPSKVLVSTPMELDPTPVGTYLCSTLLKLIGQISSSLSRLDSVFFTQVPFLLGAKGRWISTASTKIHKDSSYWSSTAKPMNFLFWWPIQNSSLLIFTFALPNVSSLARSALLVARFAN